MKLLKKRYILSIRAKQPKSLTLPQAAQGNYTKGNFDYMQRESIRERLTEFAASPRSNTTSFDTSH